LRGFIVDDSTNQPCKGIRTERLLLRPYRREDAPMLHAVLSDPETMRFWPAPFTAEQTAQWIERSLGLYESGLGRFAVIRQEDGRLIGDAGLLRLDLDGTLEYDVGYIVSAAEWRRGYGFEAAAAVVAYGFQTLGLKRMCANMAETHIASRKVAEKLGMLLEKTYINQRNRGILTCLYAIESRHHETEQAGATDESH